MLGNNLSFFGEHLGKTYQRSQDLFKRLKSQSIFSDQLGLFILLYGAEAWHIKIFEAFNIWFLQQIVGLTWEDRVSYTNIYSQTRTITLKILYGQLKTEVFLGTK